MAGQLIQIKRSDTTAAPASLANGELAYSGNGDILYIGSKTSVVPVSGKRFPGTWSANQAVVTNASGYIDTVKAGTAAANAILTASSLVLANSTVSINYGMPTAGQVTAGTAYLGANGTWQTPTSGVTSFAALSDVNVVSVANNNVLVYDAVAAKWSNKAAGNGFAFAALNLPFIQGANGITVTTAGVNVLANNGILANSTGTWVTGANGITVTAAGVNLLPNNGLSANVTGAWVVAANGIIVTAAGVNLLPNNGLSANTTGAWVVGANGITITATGVNVLAPASSGLVSNTTGAWVAAANGLTLTAAGVNVLAPATSGLISNTTGAWVKAANGILVDASGVGVIGSNGIISNTTAVWVRAGTGVVVNSIGVSIGQDVSPTAAVSFQDLNLAGNLTVTGTLSTIDAVNLVVNDSIIELARSNAANTIDIGYYGQYSDGTTRFLGLLYDTSNNCFELFANTITAPTTTIDPTLASYARGKLNSYHKAGWGTGTFEANTTGTTITANSTWAVAITANTLTLSTVLGAASGGTGLGVGANQSILVANGTGFAALAAGADGTILQVSGTTVLYGMIDGGTF